MEAGDGMHMGYELTIEDLRAWLEKAGVVSLDVHLFYLPLVTSPR